MVGRRHETIQQQRKLHLTCASFLVFYRLALPSAVHLHLSHMEAYWQNIGMHLHNLYYSSYSFCPHNLPTLVYTYSVFLGVVIPPARCVHHTLVAKRAQNKSAYTLQIPCASAY